MKDELPDADRLLELHAEKLGETLKEAPLVREPEMQAVTDVDPERLELRVLDPLDELIRDADKLRVPDPESDVEPL